MPGVIQNEWKRQEEILLKREVGEELRRYLRRAHFEGAKFVAVFLGRALDVAESPEQYARVVADLVQECAEDQMAMEGAQAKRAVKECRRNGKIKLLPPSEEGK